MNKLLSDKTKMPCAQKLGQNLAFWSKVKLVCFICFVFALVLACVEDYAPRRQKLNKLRTEIKKMRQLSQEKLAEERELNKEIYRLQNDPQYIKLIAKTKLNLQDRNEKLYRFDQKN